MSLTLTVLGCDGSYAGPGGACSGYLVRSGETNVWIDTGNGTLANLQRHLAVGQVDAVVLSHEHPDHWGDMEGLSIACWHLELPPVAVYSPAGLRAKVYHDTEKVFRWTDVADGDQISVGDLSLSFSRTDHGPETLAVRVDGGGRSLGYSADTGPGWSLEALGPGLDLALCEATYTASEEGTLPHMSARQAGTSARESGASRLVLTHRWVTVPAAQIEDEGSGAFGAVVDQAVTGAVYEV